MLYEGYMSFNQYQTYYRIIKPAHSTKTPLVMLHGGPGSTHNYFEIFDEFAQKYKQPIIMYDQIGCGNSSIPNDPSIYNRQTWLKELDALIKHLQLSSFHLLGQSFGGMLAIMYLCDYQPTNVKSVILSSTLSDANLWGQEQQRMIKELPLNLQQAIALAQETGDFTSSEYLKANEEFMLRHCAPHFTKNDPEPLWRPKKSGTLAYQTAWGPNEYSPLGNLADYNYTAKLHQIKIPSLIISGTDDLCTPLVAKTMFDNLPDAKWELFANCRHMPFVENYPKYCQILADWLNEYN
ncbi:proline iminopeptidase [Ligilactobacillus sp. Marseille-Q7487]|jgi:proline iminopeptidase|uniref:proline iminopeptidase n=1 Tax=Ligilactobacillus sp. Marseille-Q7487 TaxID=3022128 RepID=UPI0015B5D6AF|nr:proline iminopeptidase-family hydrolase [Ligilactobacillus sp. Marseille-Q7487]